MREGVTVEVNAADRARLAGIVADRNSRQKHVWHERFMRAGVEGLLHDKTRPSRIQPLPASVHERTVVLTLCWVKQATGRRR